MMTFDKGHLKQSPVKSSYSVHLLTVVSSNGGMWQRSLTHRRVLFLRDITEPGAIPYHTPGGSVESRVAQPSCVRLLKDQD